MAFTTFNDLRSATNSEPLTTTMLQEGIQGNILRGYTKPHTLCVFLRFSPDVAANKAWVQNNIIAAKAPLRVTLAREQDASPAPSVLVNFFLTATGLASLGVDVKGTSGFDPAFVRGARDERTLRLLGDPPIHDWQPEFQRAIDAAWLIACTEDDAPRLREEALAACAALTQDIFVEEGNVLDSNGAPARGWQPPQPRFEPFGYRDGVSQVVLTEEHANELGLNAPPLRWDPRRPQSVALTSDPLHGEGFCSYFVLRKLAQDVPAFRARVSEMAEKLKTAGPKLSEVYGGKADAKYGLFAPLDGKPALLPKEKIEAFVRGQIMGRMPDGKPLADSATEDDFDYSGDDGRRCPFSAHVRKANPRGLTGDLATERKRTIVRRGVAYGRADDQHDPVKGCGLLFFCAQSQIEEQFEFVQAHWINARPSELDAEPTPLRDNIAATGKNSGALRGYETEGQSARNDPSVRYKQLTTTMESDFNVYDLVTLRGAEYFYAPSAGGLLELAKSAS